MFFKLVVLFGFILGRKNQGKYHHNFFKYHCEKGKNPEYGYRAIKIVEKLIPMEVDGKENLARIGSDSNDGGYVLLDNLSSISCIYSIGIGEDFSFDLDMAGRGIFVYMFDPYLLQGEKAAAGNRFLKFYSYGVTGGNDAEEVYSSHFSNKRNLITLENMLRLDNNSNKVNMILKIDVEGWEWDVFSNISSATLSKFSQIAVEFHWFDKMVKSEEKLSIVLKAFEILNKTHQLIWVNGHNGVEYCVMGGVPIPLCVEATFVRRETGVVFKKYDTKKKRLDGRNDRKSGQYFLWWMEKDFDFGLLADSYKKLESIE